MNKMPTTQEYPCPKCGNDNLNLLEAMNQRREQMDIHCAVCSHTWTHKFRSLPSENRIPAELLKRVG